MASDRTVFDIRGPVDGSAVGGNWGDEDIPLDVRRELLKVASDKHLSYYYLCAIYRKGFTDTVQTVGPDYLATLVAAAGRADWMQVALNGGPPCFHLEGSSLCLRAERWAGHGEHHPFLSFAGLIRHLAQPRTNPSLDEALNSGDGSYRP